MTRMAGHSTSRLCRKVGIASLLGRGITPRPPESNRLRLSRALGLPRGLPADLYSPSWLLRPWRAHSCLHFSGALSVGAGRERPVFTVFSPWLGYRFTVLQ